MVFDADKAFQWWLALSVARRRHRDMLTDPWESAAPEVMEIWNQITAPENWPLLREWSKDPEDMNPVARRCVAKAVETAIKRMSASVSGPAPVGESFG